MVYCVQARQGGTIRGWAHRMTENFREPGKAAGYVSAGLTHDFPDASAEVIRLAPKRSAQRLCTIDEIGDVLKQMCRDFGPAEVEYHPSNAYGFVAEISSGGKDDEPISHVYVILTQVKGRPIAVGSKPVSRPFLDLD